MKSYHPFFVGLIILSLTTACGFLDDAGRMAGTFGDDAGRAAGAFGDDAGRAAGVFGDDAGRAAGVFGDDAGRVAGTIGDNISQASTFSSNDIASVIKGETDNILLNYSDSLTPEERDKIESVLISATCYYLKGDLEGEMPSEEDILDFIFDYLDPGLYSIQQEISNKAEAAFEIIKSFETEPELAIYRTGVNTYCDFLN